MKITKEYLESKKACSLGVKWFLTQTETDSLPLMLAAVDADHEDYALWLMRNMITTKEQAVKIAIFSAEIVIEIFEKKCPGDNRPRKAIEAAKAYLNDPSDKKGKVAADAARAADAAARAADAARAARAAARAARAAARAADAADAADAAAYAAADAADAVDAVYAARAADVIKKIIRYAHEVIKGETT